jgi:hypothetical protein
MIGVILIIGVLLILDKSTNSHVVNFANAYLVTRGIVYIFQLLIQVFLFFFSPTFWCLLLGYCALATMLK